MPGSILDPLYVDAHRLGGIRRLAHSPDVHAQLCVFKHVPDHSHQDQSRIRQHMMAGKDGSDDRDVLDHRDVDAGEL